VKDNSIATNILFGKTNKKNKHLKWKQKVCSFNYRISHAQISDQLY